LITIKFADKNVPGSPYRVDVSGISSGRLTERITRDRKAVESSHIGSQCELSLKIPGTSPFDMNAYVTSPSGRVEDCEITDLDDCNYCIKFIPKEMGIHTVSVKHKDMHIPGSPFEFTVGPIAFGGAHKVRASGPGLFKGEVYIPAEFNIYTREAGAGALAIAVEGPAKAEIDFHDRKDGTCGVSYVCPEPGDYQISIKFNDEHIPDSPFTASVQPPISEALKNLTVHSLRTKGLEINKPFTFSINVNGAKGKVDANVITPSGTEEYCLVQEMSDDHHVIRFIPHENGIHWVHVRFNGVDIPESPFRIIVGQLNADPGRVFATGTGLRSGETGEPCEFTIDTLNAGAGALAITVDGPAKVQLDCKEVAEGYKVSFVPSSPGDYLITIKFVGTNIAGSPFKCRVTGNSLNTRSTSTNIIPIVTSSTREHSNIMFETVEKSAKTSQLQTLQHGMHSDANKVKVKGAGTQKAFRNQKAQFTVDTRDAGSNMLMVGVYGPKTPCEEVVIKHVGNNQYQVTYCVRDKGEYMLIVKYGDQHIPGSPFHVDVI
jgi:filamin